MSLECNNPVISKDALKIAALRKRAEFMQKTRAFFLERSILEVDTPALCQFPSIGCSIEVMEAIVSQDINDRRYLHPSPEFGMKRLLALGIGDIYQLSHVFRRSEYGPMHNPEFSMCEWYRVGWEFAPFIEEVIEYVELFIGSKKRQYYTYEEAFLKYLHISSQKSSLHELCMVAKARGCSSTLTLDEVLDFLYSELEKELPSDKITVIVDFPAPKAALSEIYTTSEGFLVAKRFEIFYRGVELANGYKELTDPVEQEKRLEEESAHYLQLHNVDLPVDTLFLEALYRGMPPSCGVAVGFDRLVMLGSNVKNILCVLPWSWEEA